jgi:hypothetical protein
LPPPSLSLQPLPTSLRLQRSCRWLVVVSSVAPRLLRRPPSEFISPRHRAIVDAFAAGPPSPFAYHRQPLSCRSFTEHQSLTPLPLVVGCCILRPPSSIPTTSPSRKRFQFPPSWIYFDLLRVSSTCEWICDYLINTDSYVHVGLCVGNRSHRHDADSRKIGRHNRMSPTCRDDISDMSATDKNVCRLRGVADRHICRHCQPSSTYNHRFSRTE